MQKNTLNAAMKRTNIILVKPLLDKYEMASAPTQNHLSGLPEGGVEISCIDVTADI